MFSDEDTIEISENNFMRPGDEIISIREVRLSDKFDKKVLGYHSEALLPNSGRNDVSLDRSIYRDSFYPEPQARFAWTEEDGNIASLVSEAGFGTTGQTTFGKDLLDLKTENVKVPKKQEPDNSSVESTIKTRSGFIFTKKPANAEPHLVSSTSNERGSCKIDKADPRSRFHYVKYVKRQGRTIKLWECSICGREFQHQYTLMRHLPTHTDERNFHCDVCGKSFRQLSTLSQHRAIHSSDRPYSCEVCAKTFNRVSTLISHRKTHSDEKPYRCHLCPKGFHQKGNLRNHLFTHTNERPYRCNICLKGFNQQSNLVCHKNKTHPEDGCITMSRGRNAPRGRPRRPMPEVQPDSNRPASQDHCEVSSSVEPYLPSMESSSSRDWSSRSPWEDSESYPEPGDIWNDETNNLGAGVIVDPINTYHMKVALAKNQTPFALLKPENGTPVLVKVVDTNLPNGKQMLVPATADDLRDGGKFVLNKDEKNTTEKVNIESGPEIKGAVQIRVPVVATVVPKIKPCGTLQLIVEEPHYAYHTTLSSEVTTVEPCTSSAPHPPLPPLPPLPAHPPNPAHPAPPAAPPRPDALRRLDACSSYDDDPLTLKGSPYRPGGRISSTCALPLPPPSPTLDLISMDMFDPMDCIPMGPQITAVEDIDHPPPSDDSDIFIAKFEESIPLSDSE